jgi:hypothetical protein
LPGPSIVRSSKLASVFLTPLQNTIHSVDLGQSEPGGYEQFVRIHLSKEEIMPSKNKLLVALLAVAVAAAIGFADNALAASKKKLTYEEAWQRCKAFLDKQGAWGTGLQANERYTRGGACMKKYGYRI